jgi:hydroxyisourate hydrolase
MKQLALAILGGLLAFLPAQAQTNKSPGDLSTIVMDAVRGGVATGVAVELYEISGETPRKLTQVATGQDGRVDVIAGGPLPLGKYELRFHVGEYFRKQGIAAGNPAFLDFVPIRFAITDPAGHYHVPLIFWPWGYTTYRGS